MYCRLENNAVSEKQEISTETLNEIMKDAALVKIVTIIDIANMSVLELLESGLTRQEVSRALSKGVIAYEKGAPHEETAGELFESGDYFFRMLNTKVKLTELGLYILDCIKSCDPRTLGELKGHFDTSAFHPPGGPAV